MVDRREEILARLLEVARDVPGIVAAWRNKDELSETAHPAIVILDADETANEDDPSARPAGAPRLVSLTPEIYILLSGTPENVGSDLNTLRAYLVKAVLTDPALNSLTLNRVGIRYQGCATGLARGRSMEGEMGVSFAFTYVLSPAEL